MGWYTADTGNHQGLIIDEDTGRNVAVAYDKKDAPIIAASPDLLELCENLLAQLCDHVSAITPDTLRNADSIIAKAKGN